jgi:hypothetical protein
MTLSLIPPHHLFDSCFLQSWILMKELRSSMNSYETTWRQSIRQWIMFKKVGSNVKHFTRIKFRFQKNFITNSWHVSTCFNTLFLKFEWLLYACRNLLKHGSSFKIEKEGWNWTLENKFKEMMGWWMDFNSY